MALLTKSIYLAALAVLCLAGSGCSVVDPLLASEDYKVKAQGHREIRVTFEGGTKNVSRIHQQDVIQDLMLDLSRDPSQISLAFDAMLELEDFFQDNGYPLAHVEHKIEQADDGSAAAVTFQIQQGPRVTVKNLKIQGNKAVPSADLTTYWNRRQTRALGLGEDLYIAGGIESLAQAIHSHYHRLGYLDAEVSAQPLTPPLDQDTREVNITITVQENTRYTLASFDIDDNIAQAMKRHPHAPPKPGDAFVAQDVRNYALALAHHLRRHGHADPEVLTTLTANQKTRSVTARIHGDIGPVVEVSRVNISGLGYVSESNARERLAIRAGTVFDGKLEEESILRLYRSGFFKRVEVKHAPDGEGRIAVDFQVEEAERYLIQPLIGWGSYEEGRAGVQFDMLSLLGSGFDLSTKGSVSEKGYRAVTAISDTEFWPELLGFDTTFSVSADAFKREEPSYTDGAVGLSPALSHVFSREVSGRVAYIFREHGETESSVIDPGALIGDYTEGSALAEITWDSRDNPLLPKRGSRVSAQYKYYDQALGGDVSFERVRVTGSHIFPVTDSSRLLLHAESGWLTPKSGSEAIPIQERFFNGGENTVRSFREDQLAPADLKDINGQVVGGEFHNVLNLEYRHTLPSVWAIGMELCLFGDAGNVGRYSDDFGSSDMKYGFGAGVRLLLPIGPVRFDLAHNPERELGERSWTLHFSIGYPF